MRRLIGGALLALVALAITVALLTGELGGGGPFGAAFRDMMGLSEHANGRGLSASALSAHSWTEAERGLIASLSIDRLPPLPPDPSNAFGDDPAAVALGHELFFDSGLSPDGSVSCATCHQPESYFTDGKRLANVRGADTPRHTPTIVGIAYSDWFYWDGRKDSQWAQALAPQEAPVEHGGSRTAHARYVLEAYRSQYEGLFGTAPDIGDESRFPAHAAPIDDEAARAAWDGMTASDRQTVNRVFANIGKSIAAYSRRIMPGRSRFDDYAAAALVNDQARMAELFTEEEAAGLRLFFGDGQCTDCHNGPLLSNGTFHNIGLPLQEGSNFDQGRSLGTLQVVDDVFNCLGEFSDADEEACVELRFIKLEGDELVGAFKVPTLRNVAETAPYMHNGIFPDLDAVIRHYNHAPPAFPGHSDLVPLAFSEEQSAALIAFLLTLNAPPNAPPELLQPPHGEE